jgi:hypothetical protein
VGFGGLEIGSGLGDNATQKSLSEIQYHDILNHQTLLKDLPELDHPEGNPKAVRIAAADTKEFAFEYKIGEDKWIGAMTEAFVQALRESKGQEVSWRTTLVRVRELLGVRFPQQHPHVEGPYSRLHFSLRTIEESSLQVRRVDNIAYIMGGRLREVYEGHIYSIQRTGSKEYNSELEIEKATVLKVAGLDIAKTTWHPGEAWPEDGAVAFLEKLSLHRWLAVIPEELPANLASFQDRINGSKYLRLRAIGETDIPLVRFQYSMENLTLTLSDKDGVSITSLQIPNSELPLPKETFDIIVDDAEQIARSQHLLNLTCLDSKFSIKDEIEIKVGIAENEISARELEMDGTARVKDGDRIYISLHNHGKERVYVSVYNINVSGKISLVSTFSPSGIGLDENESYTIGEDQRFGGLTGISVSWPRYIQKLQPVTESLVFIRTDSPVDLTYLQGTAGKSGSRTAFSELEQLADSISSGSTRDIGGETTSLPVCYGMRIMKFTLDLPPPVRGMELPAPEETNEWKNLLGVESPADSVRTSSLPDHCLLRLPKYLLEKHIRSWPPGVQENPALRLGRKPT